MSRMVTDDLLVKCVAALRHIDGKTVAVVTSSESNAVTDYFHQQALDISSIHPGGRLATEHPEPPPQPVDLCCVEALSFQDFPEEVLLASVKPLLHDRLLLLLATRGNKSARTWESLVRAAQATGFKIICAADWTLLAGAGIAPAIEAAPHLGLPYLMPLTFTDAVTLQTKGQVWTAQQVYLKVLSREPHHAGAMHLLGLTYHQQGRSELALKWIAQAIQRDPRNAVYYNNYGAAHQALGHLIEAVGCFITAVTLKATYADAWGNLGNAWELLGDLPAADTAYRKALDNDPKHLDTLRRLSQLRCKQGRRDEALKLLEQAAQIHPDAADLFSELGNVYLLDSQPLKAIQAYETSLRLHPQRPAVRFNYANALAEVDHLDEARAEMQSACRQAPERNVWRLRSLLLCPTVFSSAADIDAYRAQLAEDVDRLAADPPQVSPAELLGIGFHPPFALSFQGREHRALKEKFAALFRQWIKPLDVKPRPGRPRIGFVVTRGHEGIFLRCCAGIVSGMDATQMDVVVCCPRCSEARLREGLRGAVSEFVVIDEEPASAAETIARAACHVLYYWEVGTDSLNYMLPFYRLAPVQVTAWGTQVTSGMREMDYYLSSKLIETDDAQRHYTEKLECFQTLPTFQQRLTAPSPVGRDHFKLPIDRPLYLCAQTILKLHPEQDATFGAVLEKDPRGLLLIKSGRFERPMQVLRARLQQSLGKLFERVVFLPWQSHQDYLRLLTVADVVLDTHHFSAGSTTYDIFSFDQPIVTFPGIWNIGRYTSACYRKMGLTQLITSSPAEYAERAYRVANDTAFSQPFRDELTRKTPALFRDQAAIQEHQAFFLRVAANHT